MDLAGQVLVDLLSADNLGAVDLEPVTALNPHLDAIDMICPLVAAERVVGVLHLVLPNEQARYFLYNRVPMTLAHHVALAFLTFADEAAPAGEGTDSGPKISNS